MQNNVLPQQKKMSVYPQRKIQNLLLYLLRLISTYVCQLFTLIKVSLRNIKHVWWIAHIKQFTRVIHMKDNYKIAHMRGTSSFNKRLLWCTIGQSLVQKLISLTYKSMVLHVRNKNMNLNFFFQSLLYSYLTVVATQKQIKKLNFVKQTFGMNTNSCRCDHAHLSEKLALLGCFNK